MGKVMVEVLGNFDDAEYVQEDVLLKKNVRYLCTDYNCSNGDIYENIDTGEIYVTNIREN